MPFARLLAAALAALPMAAAAELSADEVRVVAAVKERSGAALELLERSVRINSGTMNHAGVLEVGRVFAAELEALGFRTRWIDMPAEMQRAGHLIATREGGRGQRVLLLGHLDTVFEPQSPVQLWNRQGNRLRGQGVVDMKGGDVAIIEALRALHRFNLLDDTSITVLFTGDEERFGDPSTISRRDLVQAARASDAALSFEAVHHDRSSAAIRSTSSAAEPGASL
jgi:glutamate carboxypeptidase